MRIIVDYDLCESNALCVAEAPGVFEVRSDDFMYVLNEADPGRKRRLRQAARDPKQASNSSTIAPTWRPRRDDVGVATVGLAELVHCSVEGGVATITLDSPANRNALSRQLVTELNEALDRAEQPDVRVVVLTHTAPAFCAGADLKERGSGPTSNGPMANAMERLAGSAAPTIAAVNGSVRAGGIGIMAACDLVVVNNAVTFAFTEVLGVAPAMIAPILARFS
jgi:ferredoxin